MYVARFYGRNIILKWVSIMSKFKKEVIVEIYMDVLYDKG